MSCNYHARIAVDYPQSWKFWSGSFKAYQLPSPFKHEVEACKKLQTSDLKSHAAWHETNTEISRQEISPAFDRLRRHAPHVFASTYIAPNYFLHSGPRAEGLAHKYFPVLARLRINVPHAFAQEQVYQAILPHVLVLCQGIVVSIWATLRILSG